MRITAFRATGYRSLADLHIEHLGPFNVFYGPNGAGKSNILAAMQLLFDLLAWRSRPDTSFTDVAKPLGGCELLDLHDACNFDPRRKATLGVCLLPTAWDHARGWPGAASLTVEIDIDWSRAAVAIKRLQAGDVDLLPMTGRNTASEDQKHAGRALGIDIEDGSDSRDLLRSLMHSVARNTYALIGADRMPMYEALSSDNANVASLLAAGRLKEGLFRASNHPDVRIRKRFKQLQRLLEGEPLHRKPFEMTHDPATGTVALVEYTSESMMDVPRDVPLDLAGLGIAQVYSILGQALLRDTHTVAIEEPEAHLHAPTTGIQLRQLLERLVAEDYLEQLFIATHSNLFDLDPEGYLDVSLDERGATQVSRKPLSEIDRRHLYEPGPAKHALHDFLRYLEPDATVFRRPDGSPVSAAEMLVMLQRDDPLAVEFLRDVHGAAVRAVRVKSKRSPDAAGNP